MIVATKFISNLGESLGYLNWLLNPFHKLGTETIYDLIGHGVPTSQGLYLNLGYWENATTLGEACEALARRIATIAELSQQDRVLDCGFGFADQDMLWAREFEPREIVGLNITASQVTQARARVIQAGFSDHIDLRVGSATEMPLDDASFDAVVALECAFHFRTRARFFAEAYRVLRPGGRLVTADIIPMTTMPQGLNRPRLSLGWRLMANTFDIPKENAYPRDQYHDLLERSGFLQIDIASIRDQVYAPLHDYLRRNPDTVKALHPIARLPARATLLFSAEQLYSGLDYIVACAQKPAEEQKNYA